MGRGAGRSNHTIKLGVDYAQAIQGVKTFSKVYRQEMEELSKSSDVKIAKDAQSFLKNMIKLEDVYDKLYADTSGKVDYSEFEKFKQEVEESLKAVRDDVDSLKESLVEIGRVGFAGELSSQFDTVRNTIGETNTVLSQFFDLAKKNGIDVGLSMDTKEFENLKNRLLEIEKIQARASSEALKGFRTGIRKSFEEQDLASATSRAQSNYLNMFEKLNKAVNKFDLLKKQMNEFYEAGTQDSKEGIATRLQLVEIGLQAEETANRIKAMQNVMKDMGKSSILSAVKIPKYDKIKKTDLSYITSIAEDAKYERTLLEELRQSVGSFVSDITVSSFEMKNGGIQIPLEVVIEDEKAKQLIKDAIDSLNVYAQSYQIEIPIDFTITKNKQKYSLIKKEVKENLQEMTEGSNGEQYTLDLGNLLDNSFTNASTIVANATRRALDLVKETLEQTLTIHPNIEVEYSEEKQAELRKALFGNIGDIEKYIEETVQKREALYKKLVKGEATPKTKATEKYDVEIKAAEEAKEKIQNAFKEVQNVIDSGFGLDDARMMFTNLIEMIKQNEKYFSNLKIEIFDFDDTGQKIAKIVQIKDLLLELEKFKVGKPAGALDDLFNYMNGIGGELTGTPAFQISPYLLNLKNMAEEEQKANKYLEEFANKVKEEEEQKKELLKRKAKVESELDSAIKEEEQAKSKFAISEFSNPEKLRDTLELLELLITRFGELSEKKDISDNLIVLFNQLDIKDEQVQNMQKLANAILNLRTNLNNLNKISGNTFLDRIEGILSKKDELEKLSEVLSRSAKKIEAASKTVGADKGTKGKIKTEDTDDLTSKINEAAEAQEKLSSKLKESSEVSGSIKEVSNANENISQTSKEATDSEEKLVASIEEVMDVGGTPKIVSAQEAIIETGEKAIEVLDELSQKQKEVLENQGFGLSDLFDDKVEPSDIYANNLMEEDWKNALKLISKEGHVLGELQKLEKFVSIHDVGEGDEKEKQLQVTYKVTGAKGTSFGTFDKDGNFIPDNGKYTRIKGDTKTVSSIDIAALKKYGNLAYFSKIGSGINGEVMQDIVRGKFKSRGYKDINVSGIEKLGGEIQKLTVTATNASGALETFRYTREKVQENGVEKKGKYLVLDGDVKVGKTSVTSETAIENAQSKLAEWISKMRQQTSGAVNFVEEFNNIIRKFGDKGQHIRGESDIAEMNNMMSSVTKRVKDLQAEFMRGTTSSLNPFHNAERAIDTMGDKINALITNATKLKGDYPDLYNRISSFYGEAQKFMGIDRTALDEKGYEDYAKQFSGLSVALRGLVDEVNNIRKTEARLKVDDPYKNLDKDISRYGNLRKSIQKATIDGITPNIDDLLEASQLYNRILETIREIRSSGQYGELSFVDESKLQKSEEQLKEIRVDIEDITRKAEISNRKAFMSDMFKESIENAQRYVNLMKQAAKDEINGKPTDATIEQANKALEKHIWLLDQIEKRGFKEAFEKGGYQNKLNKMFGTMDEDIKRSTEILQATYKDKARDVLQNAIGGMDTGSYAYKAMGEKITSLFSGLGEVKNKGALDEFKNQIREVVQEYKRLNELTVKFEPDNIEDLSRMSGELAEVEQRIKEIAMQNGGKVLSDLSGGLKSDGIYEYTIRVRELNGALIDLKATYDSRIGMLGTKRIGTGLTKADAFTNFFNSIKEKTREISLYYAAVYLSPMDWIRYIRSGINYVKEMDTALTEMRKVSDESLESLKNYQLTTFDTAQRIGTTATELQTSTADWMRLGESLKDASKSAETTAVLSNVSEFENINEATDALVAVSQAYKDLDKMEIVDKLNEVGNNYSISTDELAKGLQKSSSTLSLMGNTIDEAAALITAGNATIQNAENVAAGLKIISLRLVGTKEAAEELKVEGEEIDDAFINMTESKKQQIIKDYTAVASNAYRGFDILDEKGNYKSTYDILLGISKIYKEIQAEDKKLGTNRASALIEELAGKNRSNIVAAVLQNSSMLEAVKESSEGALGSAMRENEKYLDSVQGRLDQLKTGVEEFWNKVIQSDDLKVIIQFLTQVLNIVNEIIGQIGSLPTLLSVLSPLLLNKSGTGLMSYSALRDKETGQYILDSAGKRQYEYRGLIPSLFGFENKKSIRDSLESTLTPAVESASSNLDELDASAKGWLNLAEAEEEVINTSTNVIGANQSVSASTSVLSSVLTGLGNVGKMVAATFASIAIAMVASFAITQIIKFVNTVINGDKELIEKSKRAAEEINNTFDTYNEKVSSIKSASQTLSNDEKEINSLSDALTNLGERYVELSNGVNSLDNSNISLSNEEYQTFLDTSNEIAEILPSLVSGYDSSGNAILNLGNNASEASAKMKEALEYQQQLSHYEITDKVVDQMLGIQEQDRLYNRQYLGYKQDIKDLEDAIKSWESGRISVTIEEEERLNRLNELYLELKTTKEENSALDSLMAENLKSFIPSIQSLLKTDTGFTNLNSTIQEKILGYIGGFSGKQINEIIDNAEGDSVKLISYLTTSFIEPFQEIERQGKTEDLLGLFDFDSSKKTLNEYLVYVNDSLNSIFPEDKSNVKMWKDLLGVDDLMSQQKKISKILSDTKDGIKVTKSEFDSLTMDDRNIAYDLIVNNKFEGTFNELKERIAETKKQLSEEDLFATPLLDAYNKAVQEVTDNSGDVGKNYDAYGAALKSLKEQYDKGLIGTDTFKKGAKMFSIGGATDADNFLENYKKISKYFNEEDPAEGLKKFVNDMTKLNLMEKTADGGFKTTFEDIREGAKKAKMPLELFVSMFNKLEEFGGYNDFFATEDEGFAKVGELTGDLAVAQAELKQLLETQPKNKSAIKAKEEEVKSLQDRLKDAQDQLLKFLKSGGLETYTENYKQQRSAAQSALNSLNGSKNYKNADADQKNIMLESIRAGFEDSGLDSSIYKGLGINKNGKIVLDVQASNERIDKILQDYKNGERDKKLERYGNKTVAEVVEQWAKENGLTTKQYVYGTEGTNLGVESTEPGVGALGTVGEDGAIVENTSAVRDEIAALQANTNALLGKNERQEDLEGDKRQKEQQEKKLKEKEAKLNSEQKKENARKEKEKRIQEANKEAEKGASYGIKKEKQKEKSDKKSVERKNKKLKTSPSYDKEKIEEGKKKLSEKEVNEAKRLQKEKDVEDKTLGMPDKEKMAEYWKDVMDKAEREEERYKNKESKIDSATTSGSSEIEGVVRYKAELDDGTYAEIKEVTKVDGTVEYTTNLDGVEKEVEKNPPQADGKITYHVVTEGKDPTKGKKQNKDGGTLTTKTDIDTKGFKKGKKEVEQGVHTLTQQTAKPAVDLQGAVNATNELNRFKNTLNSLPHEKKVYLTTVKRTIQDKKYNNTNKEGGVKKTTSFNGTFHLSSAYASGTTSSKDVSVKKNETALINELGNEIVVRNGKALTFNNGYPTFTKLRKGDLVFNHKQSEELERKGYVTGSHAKIYGGGSAFASGTVDDEDMFEVLGDAFVTGKSGIGNFPGSKKSTTTKTTTSNSSKSNTNNGGKDKKNTTTKKKSKKKGKSAWEKFEDKLGKLFDWIEVRLDALSTKTEKWTSLFEKFLNAASDNATNAYKAAMNAAEAQQSQASTASNKYLEQALSVGYEGADKAGKKVTHAWVNSIYQKLLDGTLDITKYGDKKKTIIDAMQGYIDKAKSAADTTEELTDSINDLIKAQRDAKIEFRKSQYSSAVEGNNGYTAATRNSGLTQSSAAARYAINTFDSSVNAGQAYLNQLGSDAISASSASSGANSKILNNVLKGKKNANARKTYTANLTAASNAIKGKQAVSEGVINYFRKMNPTLAAKYIAWNTQLANQENARTEAADNFAENMATIIENVQQSYANIDEDTERAISLAQSRAENASDYEEANKILDQLYKHQATIIANDEAEINTYATMRSSYMKGISGSDFKGAQYSGLGTGAQAYVNKIRDMAVNAANGKDMIPDNLMETLYDYYSKGYISAAFYEACRAYNLTHARWEEAQAQLEIDKETQKQENLSNYDKKASNIKSYYDAEVSMIEARKNSITGSYEDTETQLKIIDKRQKEVDELRRNLEDAVKNGYIVEGTQPWIERVVEIQEKVNDLNELELTRFETEIEEKFERAIKKADELIDKFDTIKGLIDDEMLYDKDSGRLTDMGWLYAGLNSRALAEEQDNLKRLLDERQRLVNEYTDKDGVLKGDETFDEKLSKVNSDILSTFSNIKSLNDTFLDIIEGQAEAELEALQKVVDKRKEAIQAKKE